MAILIVSDNPLFKEVIIASVGLLQTELIEFSPDQALTGISELKPDVIIIDETISPPYFEDLLAEARNLQKTRTIVINPIKNEILLVNSHRETLKKADDLIKAIGSYQHEPPSEKDDSKISDASIGIKT